MNNSWCAWGGDVLFPYSESWKLNVSKGAETVTCPGCNRVLKLRPSLNSGYGVKMIPRHKNATEARRRYTKPSGRQQ